MSGRKRVWVDTAEWERLQASASRLRDLRASLPRLVEDIRRQTARDVERGLGMLSARQRATEQALGAMSAEARELERRTSRRLASQDARLRAAVETAERATGETRRMLLEQGERLAGAVEAERQERRQEIKRLRAEIEARSARADVVARAWVADAGRLRDLVRDTLPHERYLPGSLARLEGQLEVAEETQQAGLGEAAVASAQAAYLALSDLRLELELLDRRWRLSRSAAAEALREVRAMLDGNRLRRGLGRGGEELADVELDVDHWADGRLSELERETVTLARRVDDDEEPLAEERLREIVETTAPELERRLQDVVQDAGAAQLASQLRANIADIIAQTLLEHGWTGVDGAYVGGDHRNSFVARVSSGQGGSVEVLVRPVAGRPGANEIEINSFDAEGAGTGPRVERARVLAAALRERGIVLDGDPEEVREEPAGSQRRSEPLSIDEVRAGAAAVRQAAGPVTPRAMPRR